MSYFEGKTVLVTGAATGVGEGVAQRLYQAGATVFISGRQLEQVKKPLTQSILQVKKS